MDNLDYYTFDHQFPCKSEGPNACSKSLYRRDLSLLDRSTPAPIPDNGFAFVGFATKLRTPQSPSLQALHSWRDYCEWYGIPTDRSHTQ